MKYILQTQTGVYAANEAGNIQTFLLSYAYIFESKKETKVASKWNMGFKLIQVTDKELFIASLRGK